VVGARSGAARVEFPVEKSEGDVVRCPDDESGLEQVARRVRLRAAVDEIVDQLHGGPHRAEDEQRHERNRKRPEQGRAAADLDWVDRDQDDQQHPFD
jgi:hypothetical protein